MEPTQQIVNPTAGIQNLSQPDPLHQYATTPPSAPPLQAPAPNYPQYSTTVPAQTTAVASQAVAAGVLGLIVVATGTLGANLHKVQDGDLTVGEAVNNSLVKGAAGGIATASATAASTALTSGGLAGLAITLATATGVSYLLAK